MRLPDWRPAPTLTAVLSGLPLTWSEAGDGWYTRQLPVGIMHVGTLNCGIAADAQHHPAMA